MRRVEKEHGGSFAWGRLSGVTLLQVCISGVINSVSILSVFIMADLGFNKAQIGVMASAACIGQALSSIVFGKLLDKGGRRYLVAVCGVCACAMLCCASLALSFTLYLCLLLLVGCCCAVSTPYGVKEINSWCASEHLSLAISLRQTGVPLGTMAMALVLPPVASSFGWRSAIWLAGGILAAYSLLHYAFYGKSRDKAERGEAEGGADAPRMKGDNAFLKSGNLWRLLIAGSIYMGMQYVLITYMPLYLQEACGISAAVAASYLAVSQVGGAAARIALGYISDRFFKSRCKGLLIFEGVLTLGALAGLIYSGAGTAAAALGFVAFLFGASAMGWNGLHIAMTGNIVPANNRGTAVGVLMAVLQAGTLLVPALIGSLLDIGLGYKNAFYICGALVICAIALLASVRETPKIELVKGNG